MIQALQPTRPAKWAATLPRPTYTIASPHTTPRYAGVCCAAQPRRPRDGPQAHARRPPHARLLHGKEEGACLRVGGSKEEEGRRRPEKPEKAEH
eukprot:351884-Chlamydomonas_euryale.AAC.3